MTLIFFSYFSKLVWSKVIIHQNIDLQDTKVPTEVDWSKRIRVSDVKDQQIGSKCGTAYAFSAVDALETYYFLKNNKTVRLSEQELVDCSELNLGCSGGSEAATYNYLIENGIGLNENYVYTAKKGECKKDTVTRSSAKVYGYAGVKGEENFKKALDQVGPLTVHVKASSKAFKFYKDGIFNDPSCTDEIVSHEVVLYGYGHDNKTGLDYWIIKNSWTKTWGEKGYMRVAMGEKSCLEVKTAYFPLLDESAKHKNESKDLSPLGLGIIGLIAILIGTCCCCCCLCVLCIKCCNTGCCK